MRKRVTSKTLLSMKREGEKIAMITAYDYPSAKVADAAGADIILVGDSLAMVVLGYENTISVGMDEMIHHTKAVVRGRDRAMVVFDMPFLSYQTGVRDALLNAGRALKETGCDAVKIEGGAEVVDTVKALVDAGIAVMGHVGLQPQKINVIGGYSLQTEKDKILSDAKALEEAGAFAIVVEKVPEDIGKLLSENLKIPVIGIGAGRFCDGQVLVFHDVVGLFDAFKPKFAKRYAELGKQMREAVSSYVREVKEGKFPSDEHVY